MCRLRTFQILIAFRDLVPISALLHSPFAPDHILKPNLSSKLGAKSRCRCRFKSKAKSELSDPSTDLVLILKRHQVFPVAYSAEPIYLSSSRRTDRL